MYQLGICYLLMGFIIDKTTHPITLCSHIYMIVIVHALSSHILECNKGEGEC